MHPCFRLLCSCIILSSLLCSLLCWFLYRLSWRLWCRVMCWSRFRGWSWFRSRCWTTMQWSICQNSLLWPIFILFFILTGGIKSIRFFRNNECTDNINQYTRNACRYKRNNNPYKPYNSRVNIKISCNAAANTGNEFFIFRTKEFFHKYTSHYYNLLSFLSRLS